VTIKELENCTVEYYKDEDCWLTPTKSVNKISVCEPLKDIESVENIRCRYKFHVMSIVFESFSLLLAFKSQTTMTSWIKRLNDIRRMYSTLWILCDNAFFNRFALLNFHYSVHLIPLMLTVLLIFTLYQTSKMTL